MTSPALTQASANLLAQLANPAARALALGAIAGLGLLAFRVKTTSTRLFTWTAVLYAAIAVPILGWILRPCPSPCRPCCSRRGRSFRKQKHRAARMWTSRP